MRAKAWIPAGVLALAAAGCGTSEPGALPEPDDAARVDVSLPVEAPVVLGFPATIEAGRSAALSTRMSGRIMRIAVDVGSRVNSGQVLVTLDAGDIEGAIARAEAAERQARRTFERLESLARDGAATEQEVDDARAALEVAEAAIREAVAQRSYTTLVAPFPGWVTARMADPGDLALPGQPILTLIGDGVVKAVADIPADVAIRLEPGEPLTIRHPTSSDHYRARVARLAPAVQPEARLVRVEAELESESDTPPPPLPGAYVRLEVGEGSGRTLWLPDDAVHQRGQLTGVWVVDRETLHLRWIRPGQRRAGAIEVLAGVERNELVVRHPARDLMDGQAVQATRRVEWAPAAVGPDRLAERTDRDA